MKVAATVLLLDHAVLLPEASDDRPALHLRGEAMLSLNLSVGLVMLPIELTVLHSSQEALAGWISALVRAGGIQERLGGLQDSSPLQ